LNAVNELLLNYKHHQSLLLKGSRLEYDYNLLLDECSLDDVEVYVADKYAVSSLCLFFIGDISEADQMTCCNMSLIVDAMDGYQ